MSRRVLHILSQRPSHTGSGITLDAIARRAARGGWDQGVLIALPADAPLRPVGGLPLDAVHVLRFGKEPLPFPIPGMSDVMPYESTRFSDMDEQRLEAYIGAWGIAIDKAVERFAPDLIHVNHLWLASAIVKDIAPWIPVLTHCHGTGLRQMALCPHLAAGVAIGCARNERFAALHEEQADSIATVLGVERARVAVVGAGYREEIFHRGGEAHARGDSVLYVGKYSNAKGLPWLLDAFERVRAHRPGAVLHVVGDGAGEEADRLREKMRRALGVRTHGVLSQDDLADLMRRCAVCALPSFYEGLPLVLVESLACGCRAVATALAGIRRELVPAFGASIGTIPVPALVGADTPLDEALPRFVDDLTSALLDALVAPALDPREPALARALRGFTWGAVFERVERVWLELLG